MNTRQVEPIEGTSETSSPSEMQQNCLHTYQSLLGSRYASKIMNTKKFSPIAKVIMANKAANLPTLMAPRSAGSERLNLKGK